jgi:hypothetical protein
MKKRWLYRVLVLVALAAFAVWLEPTRILWGSLRGEPWYKGRPASFWAEQIRPWDSYSLSHRPTICGGLRQRGSLRTSFGCMDWSFGTYEYTPRTSKLQMLLSQYINFPEPVWPDILEGNADAMPVLLALADHPDDVIRLWAAEGIERTETQKKGPWVSRERRWDGAAYHLIKPLPGREAAEDRSTSLAEVLSKSREQWQREAKAVEVSREQ